MKRLKPRKKTAQRLKAAARREPVVVTIDGAARGNPGPAAYGLVFEDTRGKVLAELNGRLGTATNNVAEYRALLAALAYARQRGWSALRVRTDSELLARQIQGEYKVKSADLKPLHEEATLLVAELDSFTVEAVPRRFTRRADRLANAALDGRPAYAKASLDSAPFDQAQGERDKSAGGPVRSDPSTRPSDSLRAGKRPGLAQHQNRSQLGRGAQHPQADEERRWQAGRPLSIRAVYRNGILQPLRTLDLQEGEEVVLIIERSHG